MKLEAFFHDHPKAAIAFSGGVDSAYLLYAAVHAGAQIRPYYVKTPFQPAFELSDARRLAAELGVPLSIIELDILTVANVMPNPPDRCYHCKKALFSALKDQALADGFTLLLDGTNASDDADDRPGMKALQELSVRSPLRECGLTKNEIRRLSREAGLFTWDKPAYACLATRIPAGEAITREMLERVERAEDALSRMGYRDLRCRVFNGAARLQLQKADLARAGRESETIRETLAPYFETVLLDLKGR